MIYDTFSKRTKHTKDSQIKIPRALRNQIISILDQIIQDKWESLWHGFCDEEGKPQSERNIDWRIDYDLLDAEEIHRELDAIIEEYRRYCCEQIENGTAKNVLDMMDIAFQLTHKTIQDEQVSGMDWQKKEAAYKRAVEDINIRFEEAEVNCQLIENRIMRVDSNDNNAQQETKQEKILKPDRRGHNTITIQKNARGEWEWQRIKKDGSMSGAGPFDTIEECKADIKKSELDIITIQKNAHGEWEWQRIKKDGSMSGSGPFDTIEECKADLKKHGLEKENIFIEGEEDMNNENRSRAGIDHIVTLDELEKFDINSLLEEIKSVDSRSIKWHLTKLIEQNLIEKSNALNLLMSLISFSLTLDDPNDPFKPVFVGRDGTRTLVPSDFKKEQINVIAEFARKVDNPGLRARLADVCWFIQKNPYMAEIAIDAYCESVKKVREGEAVFLDGSSFSDSFIDDSSLDVNATDMMTRAAQISHAIKWKSKASQKFKRLLTNLLEDADEKGDGYGFHLMGKILLEHEEKTLPVKQLADTAERLAKDTIVHPDLQNDLLRLADDARQKIRDKMEEGHDNEKKEEPSYSRDLKVIKKKLDSLIANSPTSRIAPTFDFGDDGLLHIISPPDLQDVANDKDLLEELKSTTDDLKQMLDGTNEYPSLLEAVVQYENALLGEQISISSLYARGVRLENAIKATRKDIGSGEAPSFSGDMEGNINSLIDLHGAYIMRQEEGKALVEAASTYHQSPQQTEKIRIAAKQFNNFVAGDTNLLGKDVKKQIDDVTQDIGNGPHPERSNQVAITTFLNLTFGILRGIVNNPAIGVMAGAALVESAPGASLVTLGTEAINVAPFLLSNAIPLLKVIATPVASDASWVASLSDLIDRIRNLQKHLDQDDR